MVAGYLKNIYFRGNQFSPASSVCNTNGFTSQLEITN